MAMRYTARTVAELAETSLELAKAKLAELPICCGHQPGFSGLNGWVYEQTIQFCLLEELSEHGLRPEVEEQARLYGRAKVDIRLDHVLIEVKARGLFGTADVERYVKYKKLADGKDNRYPFVTASESCDPYRQGVIDALGQENAFFLDGEDEWDRLVGTIVQALKNDDPTRKG